MRIEVDEEGFHKGNEKLVTLWRRDGEERGCVFETPGSVGGGWELNVVDDSDENGTIVDGTADEIADVVCFVVEGETLFGWNDDFPAGPELCLGDGVYSRKLEDDAALVLSGRKPVVDDLGLAGVGWLAIEAGAGEIDARMVFEALGKIGEEISKKLTLPSLRTEQMGENDPGVCRFHVDIATTHCER